MMLPLREYQQETIQAISTEFKAGITRQLVVLPTGTGKTICFAALAKKMNVKTIIVVHREELATQAQDKILMMWPEADIGIVKAERNELDHQIVIASVQTISRPKRLAQLQKQDFQLMIADEAQHSISVSHVEVIKGLGFMDGNPDKLLVGFTATPNRADKVGLDNVFQKVVFQRSLNLMIRAGYLCDLEAIRVKADVNLSGIKTQGGDFQQGQLQAACNTEQANNITVKAFQKYGGNRKAAAFCTGVEHAKDLAKAFRDAGIMSEAVYGAMESEERRATLQAYEQGNIQVLTNCEVLTEGWDSPATNCLIMSRPTKSQGLYQQMVGRGTRLFPGKNNCLVLEFTSNRHDICSLGSLTGLPLKPKQSLKQAIQEEAERQAQAGSQLDKVQKVVGQAYDLLDRSKFRWFPVGSDWRLPIGINEYIHLHQVEPDRYTITLTEQDGTTPLSSSTLPIGYAMGIAEDHARANAKNFSSKNAKWTKKPATEKQIATMDKLHIDYPENISTGDASQLIGQKLAERDIKLNEPATSKQVYALKAAGFEVDASLTKGQAYKLFKQLGEQNHL